jgi:hypothetical protein
MCRYGRVLDLGWRCWSHPLSWTPSSHLGLLDPGVSAFLALLLVVLVFGVVVVSAAVLGFDDEELRLKTGSVVPVPGTQ